MNSQNMMNILENISFTLNIFPFGFGILAYVLTAIGFYSLAKRRGINHPWLAWVPVANMWILGSLSDQYRYVSKGQVKNKRKVLLGLNIASSVVGLVTLILGLTAGFRVASDAMFGMIHEEEIFMAVFGGIMGLLGVLVLLLPLTVVTAVFYYMALYDLYMSCDPENSVMFLVLSIVIHVTEPFFILCNRNKDRGMPPRRPRPEQIPPYEARPREEACAPRAAEPAAPFVPAQEAQEVREADNQQTEDQKEPSGEETSSET